MNSDQYLAMLLVSDRIREGKQKPVAGIEVLPLEAVQGLFFLS